MRRACAFIKLVVFICSYWCGCVCISSSRWEKRSARAQWGQKQAKLRTNKYYNRQWIARRHRLELLQFWIDIEYFAENKATTALRHTNTSIRTQLVGHNGWHEQLACLQAILPVCDCFQCFSVKLTLSISKQNRNYSLESQTDDHEEQRVVKLKNSCAMLVNFWEKISRILASKDCGKKLPSSKKGRSRAVKN